MLKASDNKNKTKLSNNNYNNNFKKPSNKHILYAPALIQRFWSQSPSYTPNWNSVKISLDHHRAELQLE